MTSKPEEMSNVHVDGSSDKVAESEAVQGTKTGKDAELISEPSINSKASLVIVLKDNTTAVSSSIATSSCEQISSVDDKPHGTDDDVQITEVVTPKDFQSAANLWEDETTLTCAFCKETFPSKGSFTVHLTSHADMSCKEHLPLHKTKLCFYNNRYQCYNCKLKTKHRIVFQEHVRHHVLKMPYTCKVCSTEISSLLEFKLHCAGELCKSGLSDLVMKPTEIVKQVMKMLGPKAPATERFYSVGLNKEKGKLKSEREKRSEDPSNSSHQQSSTTAKQSGDTPATLSVNDPVTAEITATNKPEEVVQTEDNDASPTDENAAKIPLDRVPISDGEISDCDQDEEQPANTSQDSWQPMIIEAVGSVPQLPEPDAKLSGAAPEWPVERSVPMDQDAIQVVQGISNSVVSDGKSAEDPIVINDDDLHRATSNTKNKIKIERRANGIVLRLFQDNNGEMEDLSQLGLEIRNGSLFCCRCENSFNTEQEFLPHVSDELHTIFSFHAGLCPVCKHSPGSIPETNSPCKLAKILYRVLSVVYRSLDKGKATSPSVSASTNIHVTGAHPIAINATPQTTDGTAMSIHQSPMRIPTVNPIGVSSPPIILPGQQSGSPIIILPRGVSGGTVNSTRPGTVVLIPVQQSSVIPVQQGNLIPVQQGSVIPVQQGGVITPIVIQPVGPSASMSGPLVSVPPISVTPISSPRITASQTSPFASIAPKQLIQANPVIQNVSSPVASRLGQLISAPVTTPTSVPTPDDTNSRTSVADSPDTPLPLINITSAAQFAVTVLTKALDASSSTAPTVTSASTLGPLLSSALAPDVTNLPRVTGISTAIAAPYVVDCSVDTSSAVPPKPIISMKEQTDAIIESSMGLLMDKTLSHKPNNDDHKKQECKESTSKLVHGDSPSGNANRLLENCDDLNKLLNVEILSTFSEDLNKDVTAKTESIITETSDNLKQAVTTEAQETLTKSTEDLKKDFIPEARQEGPKTNNDSKKDMVPEAEETLPKTTEDIKKETSTKEPLDNDVYVAAPLVQSEPTGDADDGLNIGDQVLATSCKEKDTELHHVNDIPEQVDISSEQISSELDHLKSKPHITMIAKPTADKRVFMGKFCYKDNKFCCLKCKFQSTYEGPFKMHLSKHIHGKKIDGKFCKHCPPDILYNKMGHCPVLKRIIRMMVQVSELHPNWKQSIDDKKPTKDLIQSTSRNGLSYASTSGSDGQLTPKTECLDDQGDLKMSDMSEHSEPEDMDEMDHDGLESYAESVSSLQLQNVDNVIDDGHDDAGIMDLNLDEDHGPPCEKSQVDYILPVNVSPTPCTVSTKTFPEPPIALSAPGSKSLASGGSGTAASAASLKSAQVTIPETSIAQTSEVASNTGLHPDLGHVNAETELSAEQEPNTDMSTELDPDTELPTQPDVDTDLSTPADPNTELPAQLQPDTLRSTQADIEAEKSAPTELGHQIIGQTKSQQEIQPSSDSVSHADQGTPLMASECPVPAEQQSEIQIAVEPEQCNQSQQEPRPQLESQPEPCNLVSSEPRIRLAQPEVEAQPEIEAQLQDLSKPRTELEGQAEEIAQPDCQEETVIQPDHPEEPRVPQGEPERNTPLAELASNEEVPRKATEALPDAQPEICHGDEDEGGCAIIIAYSLWLLSFVVSQICCI